MKIVLDTKTKEILKQWYQDLDLDMVKIVQGSAVAWFFERFFKVAAVTIGKTIHLTGKSYWKPEDPNNIQGLSLLIHELWHIKQQKEAGTALWLAGYILEWIAVGFRDGIWLSSEVPAYAIQRRFLESQRGV